jgi:hypothetical protein
LARSDRYGDDNGGRLQTADRGDGSQHGRSGRQAVIHHDHGCASDIEVFGGKDTRTTFQLEPLVITRSVECLTRDSQPVDDLIVAEFGELTVDHRQRSHGKLTAARDADLAYQDHTERSIQLHRNLGRDRYAAARKRQYDRPLKHGLGGQRLPEKPAGSTAIGIARG